MSDTPDDVLQTHSLSDWHSLLSIDARLPLPTSEGEQSSLEDHRSPVSPPMFSQSLLSKAVHWRTWRALEPPGARLARLPSLGSQLSGLWLQVIPSQHRHRIAPAVFRYASRVYLGLPLPGGASPATRRCHDCLMVVDTLGSHWLSTCPSSRAAFYETSHRGQPRHPRHPHCTTWGRLHLDIGAVAFGSESSAR